MTTANSLPVPASTSIQLDLKQIEHVVATSKGFAWGIILGLPTLGTLAAVSMSLPVFACLMVGCFLLATALVCYRAVATFTGKLLRLLVAARLVIITVLAGLLFCTSGSAWMGVVSATLLWLIADRLLGRRALRDLWKLTRPAS